MNVDVFIDTNILVYAHDRDAGRKHARAVELIEGFWRRQDIPCLSVQVLQELHVNLVKKGLAVSRSAEVARGYLSWRVIDNSRHLFQQALTVQEAWKISFWDAQIIAAAQRAGASTLLSEDFNSGQDYGGVRVENPLA
jgi:predicted nucleic acid-binding protein